MFENVLPAAGTSAAADAGSGGAGEASLPAHVVYKIRQNASFTASTLAVRDKYWHPGPSPTGSSPDFYYQFGFVWLQVCTTDDDSQTPLQSSRTHAHTHAHV